MNLESPLLVGVCGGSGSGKTTFSRMLKDSLDEDYCFILGQDSYYIDQSHRFDGDGGSVNFDHPDAIDFDLMHEHLQYLKQGRAIQVPQYDFATHSRLTETIERAPKPVVIVDGILILSQEKIRDILDIKVFIDICEETRFGRRLKRDIKERGRDPEGVKKQFFNQVKPMHDSFVQPSLEFSDFVVFEETLYEDVIDKICRQYQLKKV